MSNVNDLHKRTGPANKRQAKKDAEAKAADLKKRRADAEERKLLKEMGL